MFKKLLLLTLAGIFATGAITYAGVTGKITGKVTDKKTGEPLELANVVLLGTQYGASTNRNGQFTILGVPAGTYDLKFAYRGYTPITVKGVLIVADITKTVDMALTELEIEVGEIEIVAERPLFEKGATNSVRVLEKDQISNLPTRGIENVASLTAGVAKADNSGGETRNATLNIRGGRGNETAYIIDGVMVNDAGNGGAAAQIAQGAVDQISLQVGGFEAKYGQAMSGVVNTVTRNGTDKYEIGAEVITSEYTDQFGYNLYGLTASGPVYGIKDLSFFGSYERTWVRDSNPRFPQEKARKDMQGAVNKYSGKLNYNYSSGLRFTTSFHGSNRMDRNYSNLYSKNNTSHNQRVLNNEWLLNQRISYTISENTFINLDAHMRYLETKRGDGVWFDNIEAYGDTTVGLMYLRSGTGTHPAQGNNYTLDAGRVFSEANTVNNGYVVGASDYIGGALSLTSQLNNHMIEAGGDYKVYTYRTYGLAPVAYAVDKDVRSATQRFYDAYGRAFGYDIYGNRSDKGDGVNTFNPLYPIEASAYIQDKIELKDLIFNVGLRYDYIAPNGKMVKNVNDPLGPENVLDPGDMVDQDVYSYFSPRLGIAFPVTESVKFHAQYGRFIARPPLFDMYAFEPRLRLLENDAQLEANNGHVKPENTIQYEAGIDYAFSNIASTDITFFYKEVRDLVNETIFESPKGKYYSTSNIDFSTIKGFSMALNTRRFADYLMVSANYTYQIAEGTGSSSSSNFIAAFRSNVIPRQVNLLDFDQRHTFTASLDARTKKNDGPEILGVSPFGNLGANITMTFNSGRPYTPVDAYDVYNGGGAPQTKSLGTVNSAVAPSSFRLDAKIDKSIALELGGNALKLNFYVWVLNLLNNENAVTVYRATGSPEDSGWLQTPVGQDGIKQSADPALYESDFKQWQKNPDNYGAARQIRLGLRLDW